MTRRDTRAARVRRSALLRLASVPLPMLLMLACGPGTQPGPPTSVPTAAPTRAPAAATTSPSAAAVAISGPFPGKATSLTAAGGTFPAPLYQKWFDVYSTLTSVQVNYQPIGSGGGIKGIQDETVDFGASDAPMTDEQLQSARGGEIVHIPTALGAIVPTSTIPDVSTKLKFSGDTLAGIYLGEIQKWNDPSSRVLLDGKDIYHRTVDPVRVRRVVGMVFQKPNPFPMLTIFENVVAGLRLEGGCSTPDLEERAERALRHAALWDEVKDVWKKASGISISGGQQQRLCIARALAVEPAVILMDEPCSALDPIATYRIEELISELKREYTIGIVTHNMQQASRVSDFTAFMLAGEDRIGRLVEDGPTSTIFTSPSKQPTEDYITGRFG